MIYNVHKNEERQEIPPSSTGANITQTGQFRPDPQNHFIKKNIALFRKILVYIQDVHPHLIRNLSKIFD